MSGHAVRTPRTDCPLTGRRTLSLPIGSVRPPVRPADSKRTNDSAAPRGPAPLWHPGEWFAEPASVLSCLRGAEFRAAVPEVCPNI